MRAATEMTAPSSPLLPGTDAGFSRVQELKKSSASLARLPEHLEFPPRLRQRIVFDARRERLSYYGFMTKADYDLLRGLSSDAAYQQALEQLFRESSAHSVVVDIGVDTFLDNNDSMHPGHSAIWRWILPLSMFVCAAGGGALLFWVLHSLR
jgi:hypothetical protein